MNNDKNLEIITLGGGCFWCLEAVFKRLNGVVEVVSGYSGGHVPEPDYRMVCSGSTGHAEVVQLRFDPQIISLEEILAAFFSIHNPTTLNRQGSDIGTQYRSVIFYHDLRQKITAQKMIQELADSQTWSDPIVTQLEPVKEFYPAEDYHHNYFEKNPYQGYCQMVIAPKLKKFEAKFDSKLKEYHPNTTG